MKKLLFIFVLLLLAIWIGFLIQKDPGYILISYNQWVLETSLWVGTLVTVIGFLVLYLLIRLIKYVASIGGRIKNWEQQRKDRKAQNQTNAGLCELAEGHWQKAEQQLLKAAEHCRAPLINYLAAARAAQELQAYERRNDHIRKAHQSTEGAQVAIALTQAQLQMNSEQWEQALATLQHIHQIAPNHQYALRLLSKVYLTLKDWEQLAKLIPRLHQYKILSESEMHTLEKLVYLSLLDKAAKSIKPTDLDTQWYKFSRAWQHEPELASTYASYLIQRHEQDSAIAIIESALKKNWHASLIQLYGNAHGSQNAKQLSTTEHWLKKHPHDPDLLLALGKLSAREQFWGKAKDYLEQSLKLSPQPETYLTLAKVFEAINDRESAMSLYRKGFSEWVKSSNPEI